MEFTRRSVSAGLLTIGTAAPLAAYADRIWPTQFNTDRAQNAARRVAPILNDLFDSKGSALGAPVFIRILKEERVLDLFAQTQEGSFYLIKTYPICNYSGTLGPKLQEGDNQSPEGFYFVTPDRLNPLSSYHLSFNIGFPNAYDRALGRTGSFLMVHGSCVSVGCYAMTDAGIEEIYTSVAAALAAKQKIVRVHIFPFAMTDTRLTQYVDHPWHGFWTNLKEGYDYFEQNRRPPNVEVANQRYVFNTAS